MSNPYLNLWHAKNTGSYVSVDWLTYAVTFSNEADDNGWAAWGRYHNKGWSDAAISAVVGMQCWECGLNPWRWQNDTVVSSNDYTGRYVDTTHGYGLPQFTPQAWYSDPEGYYQSIGLTLPTAWANFFNNNTEFRTSFGPHYSDIVGKVSDGDAQCLYIDFVCSNNFGLYFRANSHYVYGYMPFADFKTAVLGTTYNSGDNNSDYPSYTITMESLIYQWLNNFGRGVAENPASTAVRLNSANYLYHLYTGTNPPPLRRRKMPLWMMLKPIYLP